jgi:two-component system CitB family sensor kinase
MQLELTEDSHLAQTAIETNMMLSILGNLIDNAIDAAAAGAAPAAVTVRLTTCEEHDTIEVSDTGPGVPDDLGAQIFSDGFTTKSPDGRRHRGIGLALVHRLVSQAGGTISVDCSGATKFTVVLPTTERGRIEVGA